MKLHSLRQLFRRHLKEIYNTETALSKKLPALISLASPENLYIFLQHHVGQSREHKLRLFEIARTLQMPLKEKKSKAFKKLYKEGRSLLEEETSRTMENAVTIDFLHRIIHFKIAIYGTLIAFAKELGYEEVLPILDKSLHEERLDEEKLHELAGLVNQNSTLHRGESDGNEISQLEAAEKTDVAEPAEQSSAGEIKTPETANSAPVSEAHQGESSKYFPETGYSEFIEKPGGENEMPSSEAPDQSEKDAA